MTIRKIALASLLSVFAAASAHAEMYVGGQLGSASTDVDDLKQTTAISWYGGFQIPDTPVFFEGAFHDFGEAKFEDSDVKIMAKGFSVMVGLRSPRTETDRLSAYLKGGQYILKTTVDIPQFDDIDEEPSGFVLAAGFDYPVMPNLYIVGELAGFTEVAFSDDFEEGITVYSLGGRFEF